MWRFRCQKFGHMQTHCTSGITCPMCRAKDHGNTICPRPVLCVSCSGALASNTLDCPVYLHETATWEIHVEECLSFPELRKWYFELQPKPMKVTYAEMLPPALWPMKHLPNSVPTVPVCPCQPRMQRKSADPPKEPHTHESRKLSPLWQHFWSISWLCGLQEQGCPTQLNIILWGPRYGHTRKNYKLFANMPTKKA